MIITISRQIGSQGEDLGRAVAHALDLPYFDHEIIARAARIANVSEQTIEQAERVPSLLTRMIEALGRYPTGFELAEAASTVTPAPPLSSDAYRSFIEQVIEGLVHSSGAVILGHGGQMVLRGNPTAIHVYVCAPFDQRVRVVAAQEGLTPEEAKRRVRQVDQERAGFFQRYYQVNWMDGSLYDLTVNTGRMRLGAAVEAVVHIAHERNA
jgi:cytidylate kinase